LFSYFTFSRREKAKLSLPRPSEAKLSLPRPNEAKLSLSRSSLKPKDFSAILKDAKNIKTKSMKIPAKLTNFLSQNKVKFEEVNHRTVYTALDKAATLKIKPSLIAKTLVLKTGRDLIVVILAANKNLDKQKFRKAAKVKNFEFVSERLMKSRFKGFKIGAIPPFGGLFKIPAFIDSGLAKEKFILVSAGTYENSLKISPKMLEKLGAVKADFSQPKKTAKAKIKKNNKIKGK